MDVDLEKGHSTLSMEWVAEGAVWEGEASVRDMRAAWPTPVRVSTPERALKERMVTRFGILFNGCFGVRDTVNSRPGPKVTTKSPGGVRYGDITAGCPEGDADGCAVSSYKSRM